MTTCKHCDNEIWFGVHENGKKIAINSDGRGHWLTCKKKIDTSNDNPMSFTTTGEGYEETGCLCIPWEDCGICLTQ